MERSEYSLPADIIVFKIINAFQKENITVVDGMIISEHILKVISERIRLT